MPTCQVREARGGSDNATRDQAGTAARSERMLPRAFAPLPSLVRFGNVTGWGCSGMQLPPIIRGHDRRAAGQPSACRVGMCASVFERCVCRDPCRCWIGSGFLFSGHRGKSEDMQQVRFLSSHPVLQTAV